MLLCDLKKKTIATIEKIDEKKEIILKLSSMGLSKGVEIEVVKNDHLGPVILDVSGNKIIIGKGIAQKIYVSTKK